MRLLEPDEYAESVCCIDLASLYERGVRGLLIDMDNTLRPRDTGVVPQPVLDWLHRAELMGFGLCVVSNNWHANVLADCAAMGLEAVHKSMKPLPFAFSTALRKMGCGRSQAVAIGDQLLTDVLGAKLCGISTILVVPQCRKDVKITGLVRKLEKKLIGNRKPSR